MATILTIIGGLITITIMVLTKMNDRSKEKKESQDAIDQEIKKASTFDDFVRIDDKLRNK